MLRSKWRPNGAAHLGSFENVWLMVLIDEPLTRIVIAAFFAVYNKLGYGFLENVYVGALEHECRKRGLRVEREVPIAVYYDGIIVGTYRADLLIEGRLVVEVKACSNPHGKYARQLLNYLRCTNLELGLLLYFGEKPAMRRFIHRNGLKEHHRPERGTPLTGSRQEGLSIAERGERHEDGLPNAERAENNENCRMSACC
jgi:GxxExxY protein